MLDAFVDAGHWVVGETNKVFESPQQANKRYRMISTANQIAVPSTIAMIVGIAIGILGIAALSGSVIGGLMLIAFGATVFATAHDVHTCCDNLRAIQTDSKKEGKILSGDAETFCNEMLAGTWYFADFFKADILGMIKEAEAYQRSKR